MIKCECGNKKVEKDNEKAVKLYTLGKDYETIEYADKALEIDPNYEFALVTKGEALGMLVKSKEAIKCLNKDLDIDTNYKWALNSKNKAISSKDDFKNHGKSFWKR